MTSHSPPEAPSLFVIDLSRLIYAIWNRTPTGIPRVELAYAEHFATAEPGRVRFAVVDIVGRPRILDNRLATGFMAAIARHWKSETGSAVAYLGIVLRGVAIHTILLLQLGNSLHQLATKNRGRCFYIIPSQFHLEKTRSLDHLCTMGTLRLIYFVHDIIAVRLPEYFQPPAERRIRRRMEAAARLADLIVANSRATADMFRTEFGQNRGHGSIVVAPLGTTLAASARKSLAAARPYFVMIGTIEPRKNHLLVLNLWRQLRSELGEATPRLILVGSRGWENENVVDMLERSTALRGFVEERGRVCDEELSELLSGARALLLPSFAEGYGLPVADALSLGVPVICSDIASFREIGGDVPEFLDPLDGPAWRSAILSYAASSRRRDEQLRRLTNWSPPTWDQHFRTLREALDAL